MQGTKLSNIKCAVQIDTLGKECYTYDEGMFLYKECVKIPPLGMLDDVSSFSKCGSEAVKINAIINAKLSQKSYNLAQKSALIFILESRKKNV